MRTPCALIGHLLRSNAAERELGMEYWTEMRTALTLARLGTVSATAAEIGVHRATVNRHIDTLESVFGVPLFQRHARGYALTEAGKAMFEVASRADQMFSDLQGRSRNMAGQVSGKLIVTGVAGVAPTILPAIQRFHDAYPEIEIEFLAEARLARLEYGEAHIAFRTGPKPDDLDYVVRRYNPIRFGLYASESYVARAGHPDLSNLNGHKFVTPISFSRTAPYHDWLAENVTDDLIVLRSNSEEVRRQAVCIGLGMAFIDDQDAFYYKHLVEIIPPSDDVAIPLWIVTHVDLHRTAKVQAFLDCVK